MGKKISNHIAIVICAIIFIGTILSINGNFTNEAVEENKTNLIISYNREIIEEDSSEKEVELEKEESYLLPNIDKNIKIEVSPL